MDPDPTVFVVDDDPAVRDALRLLLRSVGLRAECYGSAREFLASYDPARPGCLVLDVRMPGMSGLELQEHLAAQELALPVIIITGHADVPMAVRAMKSGVVDFIEKPFSDQVLVERIQVAIERDRRRRLQYAQRAEVGARLASLTPRERQVLDRLLAGFGNKEIALELRLSRRTIELYRANLMRKLQAKNLTQVVQLALLHAGRAI